MTADATAEWAREVEEYAASLGIVLRPGAASVIVSHWTMVEGAQSRMNLTALSGDEAKIRLLFDSVTALVVYDGTGPAADIGSGAGYPGLVLAAAYPEARWVLMESIGKKARFLTKVTNQLGLDQVAVWAGRAEEWVPQNGTRFAFAVARAVGSLAMVSELALPLLERGGQFLAMRAGRGETEAEQVSGFLKQLGGEVETVKCLDLPGQQGRRALVAIRKVENTPEKFPRRSGSLGRFTQDLI